MINPLAALKAQKAQQQQAAIDKALLHFEARIGGELFGTVPADRRREFFCLDKQTWVWHEEWTDQAGKPHSLTTRYDVRPQGVFKSQGGAPQKVHGAESRYFHQAIELYVNRVQAEYSRLLAAS